jgi:tetratricopeptide (TPR) repeat protein
MSLPQIAGLELQDLVGRGSCGAVYRAVHADTREPCAVKVFSSMAINRKLLTIGMRGLEEMPPHPGLLRPLAFNFDTSPYYAAMPLVGFMAEDGRSKKTWQTPTLESSCGKTPPDEAWRYIYEVCDAMAWLHRHNLVHCNLKPRNVLVEDDQESSTKITDAVQGWVGGVHHFETTDHFLYIAPEQAAHPEGLATHGTAWDVYAFGVLAYRLLTGKFPRGADIFAEEVKRQGQTRGGMPVHVDNAAILQAVRAQQQIQWRTQPVSKCEERRRAIIERCLEIDYHARWTDCREVMHEFEKLESEYLLEEARTSVQVEKRRQRLKVAFLRMAAMIFAIAFVSASAYGLWYGKATLKRAQSAERAIDSDHAAFRTELTAREQKISELDHHLGQLREQKRLTDLNLQISQETVDQFLNQILQLPTGVGLEAEISEKQLNDALSFYDSTRERLKNDDDLLPERARNYFNTGQILLRKQKREEATEYLEKAASALRLLLQKQPGHADTPRRQALLGSSLRWLGVIKSEDGHRTDALKYFQDAVVALEPAVQGEPRNRQTRDECASAWFELGRHGRRDGLTKEAITALEKTAALLDEKVVGDKLTAQEKFLVARSHIEKGLALRDQGKTDLAMKTLFDSMEQMVKLVEGSAPRNQEQALVLAEAYIEFGDLVAGKLGSSDAREAQTEATNILSELVRLHPNSGEARYLLSRNYGALAALERDLGNAAESLRRMFMAVQAATDLVKLYPDNTRYTMEYARRKGQHAELLCDLGKAKDAAGAATEATDALEGILKKNDTQLDALDRKACGVLLAQLYGVLGHTGEVAHDAKLAKASFTKASTQWEKLKATHGDDEVIQQGLSWSKDRLAKLH